MDEAELERLRRSVDLRIDAEGRWYHEGRPFTHARLIALFDAGLDVHPDSGEAIVRIDGRWCYVQADDTPFVVRHLRVEGDALLAELNNGERLPVPERALTLGDNGVVYAELAPRRRARLGRDAQSALAAWLRDADDGALWLEPVPGRRWPIRASSGP
jgi:hypothetical protein